MIEIEVTKEVRGRSITLRTEASGKGYVLDKIEELDSILREYETSKTEGTGDFKIPAMTMPRRE